MASCPVSLASRSPSVACLLAGCQRPRDSSTSIRLANATVRALTVPAARRAATDRADNWSAVAKSTAGSTRTSIGEIQANAGGGQLVAASPDLAWAATADGTVTSPAATRL